MQTKIISILTKEDEIKKITNLLSNYSFDKLQKHPHFEFSIMEKMTDLKKLSEIFPEFGLIKSIEIRENEKGQRYYSLNYELKDETFVVISIIFDKTPPMIINGFHVNRNYKQFEKSLRRNYKDKLI